MIAVVFPGQGSQHPGMGKALAEEFSVAKHVFDTVSDATGRDVFQLCTETDEATLRETQNAQLALYTVSVAAGEVLRTELGEFAQATAGHSVGEYAALAFAGAVEIADGARLVNRRGQIMAEAGRNRPGTMAAVLGLTREELDSCCADASTDAEICVVANDNCPGQLVISGDISAVHRASGIASDRGAKRVIPLNVSGAFHSPLMTDSAQEMGKALAEVTFRPARIPVYANVLAAPGEEWAGLLQAQLEKPVRWTETMEQLRSAGLKGIVECGSGEVLLGLMRRFDRAIPGVAFVDPATLGKVRELLEA